MPVSWLIFITLFCLSCDIFNDFKTTKMATRHQHEPFHVAKQRSADVMKTNMQTA